MPIKIDTQKKLWVVEWILVSDVDGKVAVGLQDHGHTTTGRYPRRRSYFVHFYIVIIKISITCAFYLYYYLVYFYLFINGLLSYAARNLYPLQFNNSVLCVKLPNVVNVLYLGRIDWKRCTVRSVEPSSKEGVQYKSFSGQPNSFLKQLKNSHAILRRRIVS